MNRLILGIFILVTTSSFAQDIPHDSLILKSMYVNINKDKKSANFKYDNEQYTWTVVFKRLWKVSPKETLLVVVTRAPYINQHGHFWSLNTFTYLKQSSKIWKTIYMKTAENYLEETYEIKEIGPNKVALLGDGSSTGNHHFERSVSIMELTLTKPVGIGFVGLDYSNEAFISNEFKENEPCPINNVRSTFEFVKSEKDYFDLVLTQEEDNYTEGCKSKKTNSKKLTYTFIDTKYELKTP